MGPTAQASRTVTHDRAARNLKRRKLLDDFVDGVDGFGSGQRAVGCRSDDIERAFQEFFGMKPV